MLYHMHPSADSQRPTPSHSLSSRAALTRARNQHRVRFLDPLLRRINLMHRIIALYHQFRAQRQRICSSCLLGLSGSESGGAGEEGREYGVVGARGGEDTVVAE